MILNRYEKNELVYITYKKLSDLDFINHGVSTRCGGVSTGHLSSMNLSYTRGDAKENVDENFRRIAEAIGFDANKLVLTDQTHTTNIRIVTQEDAGKGYASLLDYSDIDGLVTNEKGITLAGFYADCVPLIFADPVRKVVGVAHSGWRGTVGRIGRRMIETMEKEYGSNAGDIVVAIGPSICQECYEVSEDVATEFYKEFHEKWHDSILRGNGKKGKYQLNLWKANEIILIEAGVKNENIEMPGICTCHNPSFLFSHRASNGMRGNLGAFIGIK